LTRLPVDVEGNLHVDLPGGGALELVARGQEVHLESARWRDLASARRSLRGSEATARVGEALDRADLSGVVRVRGLRVASRPRPSRSGALAPSGSRPPGRWRLHPVAVLRSFFRRPPR